jgi:signal transduction histidine kinase
MDLVIPCVIGCPSLHIYFNWLLAEENNMNVYLLFIAGTEGMLLIAAFFLLFIYNYQKRTVKQLEEKQLLELTHQRDMLHAIIRSQEDERKRIGMNLHDEVGTALSSLRMMIECYDVNADNSLPQCKSVIDRVLFDMRNISHDLSPIRQGVCDFLDALEELWDSINLGGQLSVNLFISGRDALSLNENNGLALYRVLSELLNNTIKHAKAKNVEIHFSAEREHLRIDYSDDGIGLPPTIEQKKGMGIYNIESRLNMIGATYSIDQTATKGIRMHIERINHEEKIS